MWISLSLSSIQSHTHGSFTSCDLPFNYLKDLVKTQCTQGRVAAAGNNMGTACV